MYQRLVRAPFVLICVYECASGGAWVYSRKPEDLVLFLEPSTLFSRQSLFIDLEFAN